MGQITVFSGPERRRRWSDEERLAILNQAFAPGACVAEVCRRYDISSELINRQAERFAREGVPLSTSTLADQVGAAAFALMPLYRLKRYPSGVGRGDVRRLS